jgi:hypothetical protein
MTLASTSIRKHLSVLILLMVTNNLQYCSSPSSAQTGSSTSTADIQQAVETKTLKVKVSRATSNKGRMVTLTSAYSINLTPTAFTCDLPYFGQAFGGSGYGGSGPVQFTSSDFSVETTAAKKGGWDMMIKPKDQQDVRSAALYVSESGMVTINFTFQNRTPMTYSGEVVLAK